jgi:hypothetical protein
MLRWLKIAAVNVAVLFGLFIVCEGGISLFLIFRDVTVMAWEAAPYTEYDAELGWIAKPSVALPDFWSKGVGVQTNRQRFRATGDVQPAVAPGKMRVICSGDSFTFGDGVDNPQTWCQQLASSDARIEPVNLGQGGYGADQAYLRFLRDTKALKYQVHLFAFIDDDLRRMQANTFLGFGKPVLTLENGVVTPGNIPVPRTATSHPWLIALPRALMETRMAVFVTRVLNKYGPAPAPTAEKDAETRNLLRAMFGELKRVNQQRGGTLFLVHLPTIGELGGIDPWSGFVGETAQQEGIPLIDVVSAFRTRTEARSFFLSAGTAGGHYNAAGHAFVADVVNQQIQPALGR